jgi:hypothetical protein
MSKLLGAALTLAVPAFALYLAYRIAEGVDGWFMASGAGAVLGWAFVGSMVLAFLAIPIGAFGLAARMWVVKLDERQYLESTPRVLLQRPDSHLALVDAERERVLR